VGTDLMVESENKDKYSWVSIFVETDSLKLTSELLRILQGNVRFVEPDAKEERRHFIVSFATGLHSGIYRILV